MHTICCTSSLELIHIINFFGHPTGPFLSTELGFAFNEKAYVLFIEQISSPLTAIMSMMIQQTMYLKGSRLWSNSTAISWVKPLNNILNYSIIYYLFT